MSKVLQFKPKPMTRPKHKIDKDFIEQMEAMIELYLDGQLDKIIVVATGSMGKVSNSNGLTVWQGEDILKDFIRNSNEYID